MQQPPSPRRLISDVRVHLAEVLLVIVLRIQAVQHGTIRTWSRKASVSPRDAASACKSERLRPPPPERLESSSEGGLCHPALLTLLLKNATFIVLPGSIAGGPKSDSSFVQIRPFPDRPDQVRRFRHCSTKMPDDTLDNSERPSGFTAQRVENTLASLTRIGEEGETRGLHCHAPSPASSRCISGLGGAACSPVSCLGAHRALYTHPGIPIQLEPSQEWQSEVQM